ncbi:MAG TPA: STAS domain-containing protein [Burkholderiaceae bacterium]|nr:STAS domain-containing protein [Burkholderiaceae bacterium]
MAKEDEAPGLLSKVVRFVKNPLTNWSDLDEPELDKESKYSKQMLKEMIERKRRNDFVRRREFDHLRKLRRREALTGQDQTGRPSFFQSSMPSKPDDRAGTLKKIDEIEAQMSMQWWKTKHANDPGTSINSNFPTSSSQVLESGGNPPSESHSGTGRTYAPTEPASLSSQGNLISARHSSASSAGAPGGSNAPVGRMASAGAVAAPDFADDAPPEDRGPRAYDGTLSGYSSSKILGATEPGFVHDPELEEAAIRFANGDYEGAEAGLMDTLKRETGTREGEEEIWMTLFDLHRATGRQERFENVAIDFASRFGRSAPMWFSLPDLVQQQSSPQAAGAGASAAGGAPGFNWTSPDVLGVQSVAALAAALAKAAEPWRLNWSRLIGVDDAALEPLCKLFTSWCASPVQLRFIGDEKLEQLLAESTPSGDRDANPTWWRLRMESLRIFGRADEFELVALDYCVTYEVSPPSWLSARCQYLPVSEGGHDLTEFPLVDDLPSEGPASSPNSDFNGPHTVPFSMDFSTAPTAKLVGQVVGDAAEALASLEAGVQDGEVLVVSCDRLIRVDFSAAGSVLNWVASKQAEGCQVQFRAMHRLVAIFFNVIGINEHAKVLARND